MLLTIMATCMSSQVVKLMLGVSFMVNIMGNVSPCIIVFELLR